MKDKRKLPRSVTVFVESSRYIESNGCIYEGEVLFEGFRIHKGKGTLYYPDGETIKQEGIFQSAGLLEGREYYPNGALKYEGKFNDRENGRDCNYCGPSYPIDGRFYDRSGNLVHVGSAEIEISDDFYGIMKIIAPKCYVDKSDDEIAESKTEINNIEQDKSTPRTSKQSKPSKLDKRFNWLESPPENTNYNENGFLVSDINGLMCDENALRNDLKLPNEVIDEVLYRNCWSYLLEKTGCTYNLHSVEKNQFINRTKRNYWYEVSNPEVFLKKLKKVIKQCYAEI